MSTLKDPKNLFAKDVRPVLASESFLGPVDLLAVSDIVVEQ